VTLSLFGHHAEVVAFNLSLKLLKNKRMENNGIGKNELQM
jgi:hypothetical protein